MRPTHTILRNRRLPVLLVAISMVLAACGSGTDAGEGGDDLPLVIATTTILGDIVENVAGDEATVEVLMPLGADPHEFEASAQQAARMREADLVVANGLDLEEGLLDTIEAAEADGVRVLEIGPFLDPLPYEGTHSHADEDHSHGEDDHDHADEALAGDDHDHEGEDHGDEAKADDVHDHEHEGDDGALAHACGHFDDEATEVSGGGSIDDDHTRYAVGLTDGEGSVLLARDDAGEVSFYLGSDVPFAVLDSSDSTVASEAIEAVGDECEAVAVVHTYDLEPGDYTIVLGPGGGAGSVDLVWETAGHSHGGETHGDDHSHSHGDEAKAEDDHDHSHEGGLDAHVWMDPVRMMDAVDMIAAEFDEIADGDFRARGEAYRAELEALHEEIESMIATIPADDRKLVTNHFAYGYYADRYGLEMLGTVIPAATTQAEASAAEFAELVEIIQESGVPAIFASTTEPTELAEALAQEVGRDVQVIRLYTGSLGEEGSGAETYIAMMTTSTERIVEGLTS